MISICFATIGVLTVFDKYLIDSNGNGCSNVKLMQLFFINTIFPWAYKY